MKPTHFAGAALLLAVAVNSEAVVLAGATAAD
jgi:hypothetical protein